MERKLKKITLHGILTIPSKSQKNIVYMIQCKIQRCKARYLGETERFLHDRICEHIGDIRTRNLEKPVAKHFNLLTLYQI